MYANNVLDKQAETLFDHNQYNDEAAVTIRVPLYIPYQTDRTKFERVDGKIIMNGRVYRYIKRKIVNDEMILVCIVDNKAMELNKSKTDFLKTTTGLFDNSSSKKTGSASIDFFKLLTVYNNHILSYNFSSYKMIRAHKTILLSAAKLPTFPKEPPVQPPDVV
jgi:hypothetical protein